MKAVQIVFIIGILAIVVFASKFLSRQIKPFILVSLSRKLGCKEFPAYDLKNFFDLTFKEKPFFHIHFP